MDDYVPNTAMVKMRYAIGHGGLSDEEEDARAERFDRWLAAERARVAAEARAAGAKEVEKALRAEQVKSETAASLVSPFHPASHMAHFAAVISKALADIAARIARAQGGETDE